MNAQAYQTTADALGAALAALDARFGPEANELERLRAQSKARRRRRELVRQYSDARQYWRLMAWFSEPAPRRFLSCDEATRFFVRFRARFWWAKRTEHWTLASRASGMSGCRDRLIVARYFARFGRRVWAEEREAA